MRTMWNEACTEVSVAIVVQPVLKAVYMCDEVHRMEFTTRHATVFACFRLRNLRFAHAGVYFVELYCGGEFIDDRRLQVLGEQEEEP